MSLLKQSKEQNKSTDKQQSEPARLDVTVEEETSITDSRLFTLGRGIFGGILAFMAVDNLRNLEERIGYADSMGAPMPSLSVPGISSSLLVGSIGIILWRAPAAAATAVAAFFASTTPVMHDFWTIEDPERKQQEMFHFMKNGALLGTALAFLGLARGED